MYSTAPATTSHHVADLLAIVATRNERIAATADRLARERAAVNLPTVDRLTCLAVALRPQARAELSCVDPALLLAGTAPWLGPRRYELQRHMHSLIAESARAAARLAGAGA